MGQLCASVKLIGVVCGGGSQQRAARYCLLGVRSKAGLAAITSNDVDEMPYYTQDLI